MEHILIVDDEAGIRSTLGEILADEGYTTTLASNVEETRKQLQRGFYDLAILDIWLPDGDGLDLLGEITGGGGYDALLPASMRVQVLGVEVRCLTLECLIEVKRAAGRPKDLEAIAELEAILEERDRGL